MANPLQPKIIKVLEREYKALVVNVTASSKSGIMDLLACINGQFYGFEIKWKNDQPSQLQKQKINALANAGGKGYFIRSTDQLRKVLNNHLPTERYDLTSELTL